MYGQIDEESRKVVEVQKNYKFCKEDMGPSNITHLKQVVGCACQQ